MAGPAMIIGGVLQAYSSYKSGQAAKAEGEYAAQAEEINAQATRQQASLEAAKMQREARRAIGTVTTGLASSGVSVGGGSSEDILRDTGIQMELDRQLMLYRGEIESTKMMQNAKLSRYAGKNKARSANLSAGGSLLSTVGNVAAMGELKWS